jgi:DNA adenine methylase Dam
MINPPFNFTGSKFKLLPQILPYMDYSKDVFIDVFTGGGAVYTNILDKYSTVIINDIIEDLIKIHQSLIHDDNFIDNVKKIVPNKTAKEYYNILRTDYNNNKTPEKLYALMLSCTNNMMRFNQKFKFNQTFGERSYTDTTEKKITEWVKHVSQFHNNIIYRSVDFSEIISDDSIEFKSNQLFIKNTMFYLDPPYNETEAGYNIYWLKDYDKKLYQFIKTIDENNGSFMLSGVQGKHKNGKESWIINQLIQDGYCTIVLDHSYEKVARIKNIKESHEVIIKNY